MTALQLFAEQVRATALAEGKPETADYVTSVIDATEADS